MGVVDETFFCMLPPPIRFGGALTQRGEEPTLAVEVLSLIPITRNEKCVFLRVTEYVLQLKHTPHVCCPLLSGSVNHTNQFVPFMSRSRLQFAPIYCKPSLTKITTTKNKTYVWCHEAGSKGAPRVSLRLVSFCSFVYSKISPHIFIQSKSKL